MNNKNIFHNLNISLKEDKLYLIALCFFSIIISLLMFKFNEMRGPFSPDIYVYLGGALNYAGLNIYPNVDPTHIFNPSWMSNSPVICYLTSLLFGLGWVDIRAMFVVTGFFGILGIFGMYILLKFRFSPLLSFTGAILYNSFSLVLYYFASGMLDTAAVAMIIWTLIFTVVAVDRNPRYYIIASVFFILTFFTRYTTAFILPLLGFYFLKNHDLVSLAECLFKDRNVFKNRIAGFIRSREFKWLFCSIIIGVSLFLVVIINLKSYGSDLIYFSMAQGSMVHSTDVNNPNYITDKFFYVKNFLNLLFCNNITFARLNEQFINTSPVSYLVMLILFSGFVIKLSNLKEDIKFYKNNKINVACRRNSDKIFLLASCVLLAIFIIGFKFTYIISIVCFWIFLLILMSVAKEYPVNHDNLALFLVCVGFIVFYFVIFSFNYLKCVRYILPMFPAFVYLVIYSLEKILDFIADKRKKEKSSVPKANLSGNGKFTSKLKLSNVLPILLIAIFLFSAFNFTNTVDLDNEALDVESVCDFLLDYDSNIQSKEIATNSWFKIFEWYFNSVVDRVSPSDNFTDYDYVITIGELDNDNYREIYSSGDHHVYEMII